MLIRYHYIVICTLVTMFNWWLSCKDIKLRVFIKEELVVFHWLTFSIIYAHKYYTLYIYMQLYIYIIYICIIYIYLYIYIYMYIYYINCTVISSLQFDQIKYREKLPHIFTGRVELLWILFELSSYLILQLLSEKTETRSVGSY